MICECATSDESWRTTLLDKYISPPFEVLERPPFGALILLASKPGQEGGSVLEDAKHQLQTDVMIKRCGLILPIKRSISPPDIIFDNIRLQRACCGRLFSSNSSDSQRIHLYSRAIGGRHPPSIFLFSEALDLSSSERQRQITLS